MYVNKCCFDAIAKIMVVFVIILNKLGLSIDKLAAIIGESLVSRWSNESV